MQSTQLNESLDDDFDKNTDEDGPIGFRSRTNALAVASLVLGLFPVVPIIGSILAVVFGTASKDQIDDSDEHEVGRGMAVAGIILGWIGIVGYAIFLIVVIVAVNHR